jgi:hypothetical protein
MSSSISCRINIAGIYRFGTEVRRNQYDKVICIQSKPLILVNTRFRPHIVSLQSCLHDVQKDDFATVLIWVRSSGPLHTIKSIFNRDANNRVKKFTTIHTHTIIITKGCDISYFFFKTHKMSYYAESVEYIVYILSISTSSPGGVKEHEQLYYV